MLIETIQSVAEHVEGGLRADELEGCLTTFTELLSLWHVTGNDRSLSVGLSQKVIRALARLRQRWMDLQSRRLKPSEIRDQWPPPQSASTRATELDGRIQLALALVTSFRKSHSAFEFRAAYQNLCRGPPAKTRTEHSINQWSTRRTATKTPPHRGIEFTNHTADPETPADDDKDTIRFIYNRMAASVTALQKTLVGRVLLENLQLHTQDAKSRQCAGAYPNSFCQLITEFKTTLELVSGGLEDVRAYQPILKEAWRSIDRKIVMVLAVLNCLHGVSDYHCHMIYKMASLYCHSLLCLSTRTDDMAAMLATLGSAKLKSLALKILESPPTDESKPLAFLHRGNKFYDLDRQENQRISLAQKPMEAERSCTETSFRFNKGEGWLGSSVFAPEGLTDDAPPDAGIAEWVEAATTDENMMLMTPVLYSKVLSLLSRCEDKHEFYAIMCLAEAHADVRNQALSEDELLDLTLTGNQWMQKRVGCELSARSLDFWWTLMNCRTATCRTHDTRLMRAVALTFGDVCLQYSEGFILLTDHMPDSKVYHPEYLQWVRKTKEMTTVKLSQLRVKSLLNDYQSFLYEMRANLTEGRSPQSPGVIKRYLANRDELMRIPQLEALIERKIDERLARVELRAEDAVNSALEDLKDLSDSAAKLLKQFERNPAAQHAGTVHRPVELIKTQTAQLLSLRNEMDEIRISLEQIAACPSGGTPFSGSRKGSP